MNIVKHVTKKRLFSTCEDLDIQMAEFLVDYKTLPLADCRCGGVPRIDTSMALIYCPDCGLCFEYRYNKGIIPYHTWQLAATIGKNKNDT